MSIVIAALDNSAAAEPVVATAIRLAELYSAETRAVHVREDGDEPATGAAKAANLELESVSGPPVDRLIAAAREPAMRAIVAMGWSQDLDAGRAAVVREALARSPVPILLLPVTAVD
jgi:hypothetical protein